MSYTSPTSSTERATVEKSFKELQLDDNSKHDSAAATMESDHPPERRAAGPQTENPDSTESNSVDAAGEPSLPSGNDIGDKWDDALVRTKLNAAAQAASSGEDNSPKARWHRAFVFAKQISGPKLEQEKSQDPVGVQAAQDVESRSATNAAAIARATSFDVKGMVQRAKEKAYNRDPETGKRRPFKGAGGQKAIKVKKKLEEQHWLEMIDPKHRYGSNLKYYFEEWKLSDAQGNFFYWLDNGSGKNFSLAKCPREKLERENILYLAVEQRRHYLIYIDPKDGKFRWRYPSKEAVEYTGKEHPLVDTTGQLWTDLGNGRGLAPAAALPQPEAQPAEAQEADISTSETETEEVDDSAGYSSDASLSSLDIPDEARPGMLHRTSSASLPSASSLSPEPSPIQPGPESAGETGSSLTAKETKQEQKIETKKNKKKKKKKEKGDVWIYASDSEYNIYLGIKQKGKFQHSSFLAGGPITSAGTLIIKNGILLACNPMSGHYRTKAVYFKRFIEELEREGADLSQVKVGQTELKLWFVERANTLHSLKGKTRRLAKGVEKKLHIDERHHQPLEGVVEQKEKKKKNS